MSPLNFTHILTQAVDELSESESYKGLFHQHTDGNPLPSAKALCDIIELARAIIFPGYFGNSTVNSRTVTYHIGVNVERLFDLLTEQILAGLCFGSDDECSCCTELQREEAASIAALIHLVIKSPVDRGNGGDRQKQQPDRAAAELAVFRTDTAHQHCYTSLRFRAFHVITANRTQSAIVTPSSQTG